MTIVQLITLFIIFNSSILSTQHFIPPLQGCIAAEICNHTWTSVCGLDKTTSKIRPFPDECDMIEYNCDYKTDYVAIDQEKCKNNTSINDMFSKKGINMTPTVPGRRFNVESVINDPGYDTSPSPYSDDKNSDDESYLNVSRDTDRLRLLDRILRTRRVNIKTIVPVENLTLSTTAAFIDVHKTNSDSNDVVTTTMLPSLTITYTNMAEDITVKSAFDDVLRHAPQCTCGQHTSVLPTTPITKVVTTTASKSVSTERECTRHKSTTALNTVSSTTEVASTSQQTTNATELSSESTTVIVPVTTSFTEHVSHSFDTNGLCTCGQHLTEAMTTLSNATNPSDLDNLTTTVITTTPEATTTSTTLVSTTTEHAHSFDADGTCNCGKVTTITATTTSTSTTTEPKTTIEVTTTTTASANETGGECTCYMNTTPVMTSSSMTSEQTTEASTTTLVTTTSPTATPSTAPTTTIEPTTTIATSTITPAHNECTCNMKTDPVTTTTPMTTKVITTAIPITITTITTATIPTTTTATSPATTTLTESTTAPITFRECTCGQRPDETTSESTKTTEPTNTKSTTTTTITITTTTPTTTEPTTTEQITQPVGRCTCNMDTTAKELATTTPSTTTMTTTPTTEPTTTEPTNTEQVTEPVGRCTCNMDTTTLTTPLTTTTATNTESSTTESEPEDITNNEIDSITTEATKKSSKATCYRKDCKRPSTWETTSKGETRDFYRILKERFGNRVKILRATTHWPLRIPKQQRFRDYFMYGRHNEG